MSSALLYWAHLARFRIVNVLRHMPIMKQKGEPDEAPGGMKIVAELLLGHPGRMLPGAGGSKTMYLMANPGSNAFFDASLCVKEKGFSFGPAKRLKLWWGDFDLATDDGETIQTLANELKQTVYVYSRSDDECLDPRHKIKPEKA